MWHLVDLIVLQVRAFLTIPDDSGSGRRELNQSPLPFIEATQQPHAHQALARKDTIIRVRNAQARLTLLFILCPKGKWHNFENLNVFAS